MSVDKVKEAVKKELDGPGKLLGYRAMYHKVRQDHELKVPPDLVHTAMYDLDPKGLGRPWTSWQEESQNQSQFFLQKTQLCSFIGWP